MSEIMGDATPEERAAWDKARHERREVIRSLFPQINAARMTLHTLEERRDEHIREALTFGTSVNNLVEDSGLTPARIYQIRDRRR